MRRRSRSAIATPVVVGVIVVLGGGLRFSSLTTEGRPLAFVQTPKSAASPATTTIGNTILAGELRLLYDDPEFHDLAPAVGEVGVQPELYLNTLAPDSTNGELAVLNCYETDRTNQHPLKKESVKLVRVLGGCRCDPRAAQAPRFCRFRAFRTNR